MTVALVNSMTSLYAAVVVFSMLGFKAAQDYGRCLDRCARRPQGPQGPTHDLVSSGAEVWSVPGMAQPRAAGGDLPGNRAFAAGAGSGGARPGRVSPQRREGTGVRGSRSVGP